MPAAPAYEWEESETAVTVKVCRRGFPRGNNDMLSTDVLLKVSASPYLLLLDLHGEVDSAATVATVSDEHLTFVLQKKTPGLWGRLTARGDKADLARRREASMEAAYERLRAEDAARAQSRRKAAREREDHKYQKHDNVINAHIAAHGARMARTKNDVSEWKATLPQQQLPADGVQQAASVQVPPQNGSHSEVGGDHSSDSDDEPLAADHPDYFGRGWQPSKAQTKEQPADDSAKAAASASKKNAQWDTISTDSSDSDDEGNGQQLKEVSTRREPPPEPPEEIPQPAKPPPRSNLPSLKVDFTDTKLRPGIPARTPLPDKEHEAPPPEERKLELHPDVRP